MSGSREGDTSMPWPWRHSGNYSVCGAIRTERDRSARGRLGYDRERVKCRTQPPLSLPLAAFLYASKRRQKASLCVQYLWFWWRKCVCKPVKKLDKKEGGRAAMALCLLSAHSQACVEGDEGANKSTKGSAKSTSKNHNSKDDDDNQPIFFLILNHPSSFSLTIPWFRVWVCVQGFEAWGGVQLSAKGCVKERRQGYFFQAPLLLSFSHE